MAKQEISGAERRMLEELAAGFPALARELRVKMEQAQAIQQRLAAQVSMFQAYGWEIPQVEGLTIQTGQLPQAAQDALMQQLQMRHAVAGAEKVVEVQPPQVTSPPLERKSARSLVRAVLQDGGELTVAELREVIKKKYGQVLAVPTVYRILGDRDLYANNPEGKWRLKK